MWRLCLKCLLSIGSNLSDRAANLELAANLIKSHPDLIKLKGSLLFENPALTPKNAPLDWHKFYLNSVLELTFKKTQDPKELLAFLKSIEREMGRNPKAERWAPRVIDLDILKLGEKTVSQENLIIPHPLMNERDFVLSPLKYLSQEEEVLRNYRLLKHVSTPTFMGILNLTPDSFSDGGNLNNKKAIEEKLEAYDKAFIQILDLGAESTRPGAKRVSEKEEWERLKGPLKLIKERYRGKTFKPLISIDTTSSHTAELALENGADLINDVSGLSDLRMIEVLKKYPSSRYVLMHSLSVPANRDIVLPSNIDPVKEIKSWAIEKLETLKKEGIDLSRVIFDPGIGFGKTPEASIEILKRVSEFFELPVKLMIGHSRKSFLSRFTDLPADKRDPESIAISLKLANLGIDILRVHEADLHARAFKALSGVL